MKNVNFTIEQIIADAQNISDSNKKDLAQKYDIQSNKIKEIQSDIYKIGLQIVRNKTVFLDKQDALVFDRYYDFPASSQKIKSSLDTMNNEFCRFYNELIQNSPKCGSYFIRRAKTIAKYFENRMKSVDLTLISIKNSLYDQTFDFHEEYIRAHREAGELHFDSMLKFKDVRTIADACKIWKHETHEEVNTMRKNFAYICSFRRKSEDFNKKAYIDYIISQAEKEFDRCITLIAERIKTANMNVGELNVKQIWKSDAKAFEIYVSDSERVMHARSIWCAATSDIVTAHWRFIITNA